MRSEMRRRQLRGDAEHGKDELGKVSGRIHDGLGKRTQARAGALHVGGNHQKVGRVAREAANRRDDG